MGDKTKVLVFSDSTVVPTGYSRVCKEIFSRLNRNKFDVTHWGKQTFGYPHYVSYFHEFADKDLKGVYTDALNADAFSSLDSFEKWFGSHFVRQVPMNNVQDGSDIADAHLSKEKPDIFFELLDMWMADWVLNKDFTPGKFVMYYPADGYPLPFGCHRHILKADVPVAMSKFAKALTEQTLLDEYQNGEQVKLTDRLMRPVEYIPHGVNTKVYAPLPDKIREELKAKSGVGNKFVFGMVARNQPRKSHERLFKAFAKFQKGKPDVALWLHCDPRDPQGYNLQAMAQRFKINPIFTRMHSFKWGIGDMQLNEIYNIFDCHILSTTGEGFGLPIIEAASAGLPQILVDYTTSRELLGEEVNVFNPDLYQDVLPANTHTKQGILVPPITLVDGSFEVERAIPSINGLTDAMEYMYANRAEAKQMGRRARMFAAEGYDWGPITKQWEDLFERSVNGGGK